MSEAVDPRIEEPETIDVWDLFSLDEGAELRITMPRAFLHLLQSPGTRKVEIRREDGGAILNAGGDKVRLVAFGPMADDENFHVGRLTLTRDVVHHEVLGLTKEEQVQLYERVASFFDTKNAGNRVLLARFRSALNLPKVVG